MPGGATTTGIFHRYFSKLRGRGGQALGGVAYKDRARPPPREYMPPAEARESKLMFAVSSGVHLRCSSRGHKCQHRKLRPIPPGFTPCVWLPPGVAKLRECSQPLRPRCGWFCHLHVHDVHSAPEAPFYDTCTSRSGTTCRTGFIQTF